MNVSKFPARRGITLTEILISILIMGVGLVSLASLFPVGLERMRQAQRNTRSAFLKPAAVADLDAKFLLAKSRFDSTPWFGQFDHPQGFGMGYDPWVQDLATGAQTPLPTGARVQIPPGSGIEYLIANRGVYRGLGVTYTLTGQRINYTEFPKTGEGLPVCYDPLWWAIVSRQNNPTLSTWISSGILTDDPPPFTRFAFCPPGALVRGTTAGAFNDGGVNNASADGLQRLTNYALLDPAEEAVIARTFVSSDDMVLQQEGELSSQAYTDPLGVAHTAWVNGSPILPTIDFAAGNPIPSMTFDYSFSWMFTGRRVDALDPTAYVGDIVVFHNRAFALDNLAGGQVVPAGERVVEAIFGYGGTPRIGTTGGFISGTQMGYSPNSRSVLLRWPTTAPDPEVRVGGWIADVTYERHSQQETRFDAAVNSMFPAGSVVQPNEFYPAQRCYWYRIVRKGEIEDVRLGQNPSVAYRQMAVTIETPLQARTLVWGAAGANPGQPVFTNVALISPYVVNVFPVSFRTK